MNHIILGSKQVFLGTIRLVRGLLDDYGLTPARFNMLSAILSTRGGVAQRILRTRLGVSAPTISRMLKSLEKLGLVFRTPHPRHRQHKWVEATAAGLFRLRAATEELVDGHVLGYLTREILNPFPGNTAAGDAAIAEADVVFSRLRERLGDVATHRFPYDEDYGPCGGLGFVPPSNAHDPLSPGAPFIDYRAPLRHAPFFELAARSTLSTNFAGDHLFQ